MNAIHAKVREADLIATHVLAELLEQFETSTMSVGAEQYCLVVRRLTSELANVKPRQALGALLEGHPVAAKVYENVNYLYAGLCRSALKASLASEQRAKEVLERVMHRVMNRSSNTSNKEDPTHGKS